MTTLMASAASMSVPGTSHTIGKNPPACPGSAEKNIPYIIGDLARVNVDQVWIPHRDHSLVGDQGNPGTAGEDKSPLMSSFKAVAAAFSLAPPDGLS